MAAEGTAGVGAPVASVTAPVPRETRQGPLPDMALRSGKGDLSLPRMTAVTPEPPDVLKALVDNHRRFLAFLEKRVGSREEAEDILQDGFVKALEKGAGVQQPESVIPWFYRLLRNAVTDHYRKRGSHARALELAVSREDTSVEQDDRELHDTVCGCVLGLLDTLKPEYSAALKEVDLNDKSVSEYASSQDITPGNAAVRLHRAREALRKQVIRCCGTCADHGCEDCSCKEGYFFSPGLTIHIR